MIDTWKCGVCFEERPDEKISVITYPMEGLLGAEINLKYCNDNDECYNKAIAKSKTGNL